ncbi:MAG: hypothetical protein J6J86_00470 [Lachnospiraceae bacterium]|nr:hypothetical protein [Lachnospiraceae bacterium]
MEKEEKKQSVSRFTKEQILSSKKYRDSRDLLQAVLEDSSTYSLEEVEKKIEDYRKGKVK